jgi:hypothetical protein
VLLAAAGKEKAELLWAVDKDEVEDEFDDVVGAAVLDDAAVKEIAG